jgi:hypothetical protein
MESEKGVREDGFHLWWKNVSFRIGRAPTSSKTSRVHAAYPES